jgi:UDP-N-acetylmuramoyl-tripeptide--D-alanyl-D-alanine ligase
MPLTLQSLLESLNQPRPPGETPITRVVIDSREAVPGSLFVALRGDHTDGHAYVADALKRGVVAALVDRPVEGVEVDRLIIVEDSLTALQSAARWWHRHWVDQTGGRTIGITGSVGKSSAKELVADVLAVKFSTLRNAGSYNNEIGLPLTVLHLREDHRRAVLEMGFYVPGEIDLLTGIAPPQIGLVTLIAPVHLERAKTLETLIEGKAELLDALPPDGAAILNGDDSHVMKMAGHSRAKIITYGLDPKADVWADQIEGLGLGGVRFRLHLEGKSHPVKLKLLGRHSVYTALGAAAVGWIEGLTPDQITAGLEGSQGGLRLVARSGINGSILLDDTYNASPPSMIAALNLLSDLRSDPKTRRLISVLGDMRELGAYEEEGHQKVGMRAAEVVDVLVTVGEGGRIIARQAVHSGMITADIKVCATAKEAIAFLRQEIRAGDMIVVKGSRAVHMEQIVAQLRASL